MALLERLAILITADAAGAINEMKKVAASAEKDLGKAGTEGSKLSTNMTKVGAGMVAAGAGLLAVGVASADTATSLGREVMKLQRYTNMTAEEASKLAFAAKMSGVPVDSLATGLGKLSKAMETGSPVFDKLGVSARDSDGKLRSMGEVLPDLAEKFKTMPNGPEKTAEALQLFGRAGMDLMPFLNKGKEGIKQLSDTAEKMGLVLSQDNIGQIKAHIQSQRELGAAFDGIKTQIGLTMIPLLDGFTNAFKGLPGPIQDVVGPLTVFGGGFLVVAGSIGMLVGQLSNLAPAFAAVTAFAAANPLMAAVIGIGVAIGLIATAFAIFGDHESKATKLTKEYADAMDEGAQATNDFIDKKVKDALASKHLTDAALTAGLGVSQLSEIIKTGGTDLHEYAVRAADAYAGVKRTDAFTTASAAVQSFDKSLGDAVRTGQITYEQAVNIAKVVDEQSAAYRAAQAQQQALDATQQEYTNKVSLLEQAQNAAATATSRHTEAAKALDDAMHKTFDPVFKMVDAQNKIAEGQRNVAEATQTVADKTKALNEARAGGDPSKVAAAERDLADATQKLSEANINATKNAMEFQSAQQQLLASVKDNPKALDDAIAKVEEYGRTGLITKEQVDIMKQAIRDAAAVAQGFPNELQMKITLSTWEFWSDISKVKTYLDNMTAEQRAAAAATIAGARVSGGRVGPGMAMGGRPASNGYLVGELGPEIFWPDSAGTIVTAEKTKQMLSSSGGGVSVTNVTINMPPGSNGADVVDAIKRYEKTNGTRWRK